MVDICTHQATGMEKWQVINQIRKHIRRAGSQKALAAEWGISPQYLTDILRGRREPGDTVLKALGLQKHVVYITRQEPLEYISE